MSDQNQKADMIFKEAVEKVIARLSLDDFTSEQREATVARLGGLIMQGATMRVMELLSEEDQKEAETVLKNENDPAKVMAWLAEKVPDFSEIIREEGENLLSETLANMEKIKQDLKA